jgi:hypothetical protein
MYKRCQVNRVIPMAIIFIAFVMIGDYHFYAFEISKSFEINFDYEVTFFSDEEKIIVWDYITSKIFIYEENQLKKTINFNSGQGPQDFQVVSAVLTDLDHYYVWDRTLRRFSIYKKNWDFVEIKIIHNIPSISLPLGITDRGFLFIWNKLVKQKKGSDIISNIGIINEDEQENPTYKISGTFNKMGKINYNRPILIPAFSKGSKVYFGNNQEYKIYAIDLNSKDSTPSLVIERKVKSTAWRKDFEELRWEVIKKSPLDSQYIYPEFVPPLFSLAVNDNMIAIISNEMLQEKKTVVDFFKGGKFLGTAKIPLLYSQYFVFPSHLCFPSEVFLGKNFLLTFVYDTNAENYKIIKWKIEQ